MFCILLAIIFIILYPILGIFSKEFRVMSRKAISCAFKKVTLKPCDQDFGAEVKAKLLGKIIFKYPRLAKFIDKSAGVIALVIVVINIIGLLYFLNGALNLFVYDTCYPTNGASCSLSGEACSIDQVSNPTLWETLSRIPNRLKTWEPKEYISSTATYYNAYDSSKKTALEIIDPGCIICKNLFGNIKQAGFENKYNLTYIVYPIPQDGSYKFRNSYLIATYLEALKMHPIKGAVTPADWALIERIFTGKDANGLDYQAGLNISYTTDQVNSFFTDSLRSFGYNDQEIASIKADASSDSVKAKLSEQKNSVENVIKTIKIPTIMFNGKRYDRLISVDDLK
ncbi:MAG: hypothetical protein WCO33_04450 [bacterium]